MTHNNDDNSPKPSAMWHVQRATRTIAALVITLVAIGGFYVAFSTRGGQGQADGATPTTAPDPPTSVLLSVSAPGISPITHGDVTIPSGTTVTLTVLPDHPLTPFQTFTMGIYAHDPSGFSELQYCAYPDTGACSYVVSYSSAEATDYARGTHTFTAFLGNIGGAVLNNSQDITITWSQ
jgi:hypothetical protein